MERKDIQNVLQVLNGCYVINNLADYTSAMQIILAVAEKELVLKNLHEYITNPDNKFKPVPAQLIKSNEIDVDLKAQKAWMLILDSVRRVGTSGNIVITDYALGNALQSVGGYNYLCDSMNNDNRNFIKKDFINCYKSFNIEVKTDYILQYKGFGGFKLDTYLLDIDNTSSVKPINALEYKSGSSKTGNLINKLSLQFKL